MESSTTSPPTRCGLNIITFMTEQRGWAHRRRWLKYRAGHRRDRGLDRAISELFFGGYSQPEELVSGTSTVAADSIHPANPRDDGGTPVSDRPVQGNKARMAKHSKLYVYHCTTIQ